MLDTEKIAYEILLKLLDKEDYSDAVSNAIKIASEFIQAIKEKRKDKPKSENNTTNADKFLSWFNARKKAVTGQESRFKTLTSVDMNNYIKISKSYNKEDFEIAISNLFKSDWAQKNNMIQPSHFLRIENFNRYLGKGVESSEDKNSLYNEQLG